MKYTYFQIKPFKENDYSISHYLGFLQNFLSIKKEITFSVTGNSNNIKLIVKVPNKLKTFFENSFYAIFSESELKEIKHKELKTIKYINFQEKKDFAISTSKDFTKKGLYTEPFKDILHLFNTIPSSEILEISYITKFKNENTIWDILLNFFLKLFGIERENPQGKIKIKIAFSTTIKDKTSKESLNHHLKNTFSKFIKNGEVKISKIAKAFFCDDNQFVNFYHILNKEYFIKNLEYLEYRKLPYPNNLPTAKNTEKEKITFLGYTEYKNDKIKFGLKEEDKLRHTYIIGKTGMGKSTLISNMVLSDLRANSGLCVIDLHGDLIDTVLSYVPKHRINDVVLFDVSDFDYPIGFNILQAKNEEEKNIIVSGLVATFKKLYQDSWGPRLEYILRNTLLAVIQYPNSNLLYITRMLTDKNFRLEVLEYVQDPIVLKFWTDEFEKRTDKFRDEAISPIVNKVGQFLSSPVVRNIFGQEKTKLDLRKIMDEGKILLVNLSKGKIGEDNASMIGSFLVTKLAIEAMARANIAFENRKPFYLYIDEFQNFATDSFENILSEARKYKLALILANQYISQISDNIKNAIFGNVGTIISFGIGYEDAQIISKQFKEIVSSNDILSLPKFTAYIKLTIDGLTTNHFSMTTFPLPKPENQEEITTKVRNQTRQRYAIERAKLEKVIKHWSENKFTQTDKALEKAKTIKTSGKEIKSIDELKKDTWYSGIIKLKYNFGVFVVLNGGKVEGLLHKKKMKVPEGISWKDIYNIGGSVKVKVDTIKTKEDGEKEAEFTQI